MTGKALDSSKLYAKLMRHEESEPTQSQVIAIGLLEDVLRRIEPDDHERPVFDAEGDLLKTRKTSLSLVGSVDGRGIQ